MKVFLDANILVDIVDNSRVLSKESAQLFEFFIQNDENYELYTSCDLLTTVYYLTKKPLGKVNALQQIKIFNQTIYVIAFANDEIDEAITLMERNMKYFDLEDTIQYVMARKEKCDYIITNDKKFASGDVPVLSSKSALEVLRKK
jgi:predicted nucleic acid-binding protein